MTDSLRSRDAAPAGRTGRSCWRTVSGALYGLLYAIAVFALFGGIAVDHLPDSPMVRLGLLFVGAAVVLLAAIWLDRRERHGE